MSKSSIRTLVHNFNKIGGQTVGNILILPPHLSGAEPEVQELLLQGFKIQGDLFKEFSETVERPLTPQSVIYLLNSSKYIVEEEIKEYLYTLGNKSIRYIKQELNDRGLKLWEEFFEDVQSYDSEA